MRRAAEQARGYPSDLTDAQWQVIAVHLPAEVPGRRGRPRALPLRQIVAGIFDLDPAARAGRIGPVASTPGSGGGGPQHVKIPRRRAPGPTPPAWGGPPPRGVVERTFA